MPVLDLWILNKDRNPFFFLFSDNISGHDPLLLANFLGALDSFTVELGEGRLESIMFHNRMFHFIEANDFLFILMTSAHSPELYGKALQIFSSLFFKFVPNTVQQSLQEQIIFRKDEVLFSLLRVWIVDLISLFETSSEAWQFAFQFSPSISDPVILRTVKFFTDKMIEAYPTRSILYYNKLLKLIKEVPNFSELLFMAGVAFGHSIHSKLNPKVLLTTELDVYQVLEPISILKHNEKTRSLDIYMCPFCRGVKSEHAFCDFVRGVFMGVLHRNNIVVNEVKCIAKGDSTCSFRVHEAKT